MSGGQLNSSDFVVSTPSGAIARTLRAIVEAPNVSPKPKTVDTKTQGQENPGTKRPKGLKRIQRVPSLVPYDPEAIKHKGRPPVWTEEKKAHAKNEILTRLTGGEYVTDITDDLHMPAVQTLWHWREKDPAFKEAFTRAQDDGYEVRFNGLSKIAGNRENDVAVVEMPNGTFKAITNTVAVARDRLIVETEARVLAMARPKRYGQKLQHVGGDETDAPIAVKTESSTDRELAKAIASILARSQGSKTDE